MHETRVRRKRQLCRQDAIQHVQHEQRLRLRKLRVQERGASVQRARSLFDYTDYGTPLRHADIDVTLEIDGQAVTVPAGTSVMRAAIEAGVNVPKLCATDSLEPFGSCRLCLVEIEGKRGYPASCTTPVEAGMKVRTQTRPPAVAAQERDGALHLRSPARLPHLPRQRRLRAAGHGGRRRPARSALRLRRREPPEGQEGRIESVLHLRPVEVHRLQSLRARLRGNARHVRADDRRRAASNRASPRARTCRSWNRSACRAARASPPARPRRCRKRPSSCSASPSIRS